MYVVYKMGKHNITRKKKTLWTLEAEQLLCEIWGGYTAELRRGTRKDKGRVYKEMAAEMKARRYSFSPEEVHTKLNNLTAKYRKKSTEVADLISSPCDWPLYETIHEILGHSADHSLKDMTMKCSPESYKENSDPPVIRETSTDSHDSPNTALSLSSDDDDLNDIKPDISEESFQNKVLQQLRQLTKLNAYQIEKDWETTNQILKIQKRRNELIQEYVSDSRKFHTSLLDILKNKLES